MVQEAAVTVEHWSIVVLALALAFSLWPKKRSGKKFIESTAAEYERKRLKDLADLKNCYEAKLLRERFDRERR